MNLKQFKLTNDDEIICEVVQDSELPEEEGNIIIRKALKIACAEDFENNVRYYSFRPWVSFQESSDELSVLNAYHIIGETLPSKRLVIHYAAAIKEVTSAERSKREFNLDKLIDEIGDLSADELAAFIDQKIAEEEFDAMFKKDSDSSNVIQFRPPKDTMH